MYGFIITLIRLVKSISILIHNWRTKFTKIIFLSNLNDNFQTIYLLQGHYVVPTQPAVALSFLCILLDVLRHLFNTETTNQKDCISPRYFFDSTLKYTHMDRLGGNLSYLRNVYKKELIEVLGANHVVLTEEPTERENQSNMSICK